ncbi:acyl-CoA thioesterase [Paenibacillus nasutitermitis]|uniref:4-hydroxybenzoyl-CoA thioesterase n=1 Tax=Paenibacillus nasutitermitis TaxID=1652958 RepID=A0A916Z371_9BACL|nr:thioesterase family protein [Paenibacillus nasutitermitis]GGD74093.1 4-hydroxybenzoyl-CoA thioesterase [Paenibacillus nasutitermitis]
MHPLRVRYQESDRMGVVFHANYVNWMEIGRTELIRFFGIPYRTIEEQGMLLPVVDLECRYIAPAKYDDLVVICTAIEEYSPVRLSFRSEIRRISDKETYPPTWQGSELPGELLVRGSTRHVWVNAQMRPSRLDKALPELYKLLEQAADGKA